MNQKERDQILLEMYKNYQPMKKDQKEFREEMQEMKRDQKEFREEMQEMKKEHQEFRKEMQEMKKDQRTIQEELIKLGNVVTRIEYEHGRKLDMILDVLMGHADKIEEHENRFEKDEKVIEIHGHKIYGIEQRLQA